MPTKAGGLTMLFAVVVAGIGRVFGVGELFILAAGMGGAVVLAGAVVNLRRHRLEVDRWIHPPILTVGDRGRVELTITNSGRAKNPPVMLVEPVGRSSEVRLRVDGIRAGRSVVTGYVLPASRRGVLRIGPQILWRRDLLGLAATRTISAGEADVLVAPRTHELAMPLLGRGSLGNHLSMQARRLGQGEFHGLRDYVDGDEPRSIHWRASARSEELKVRQHTAEGVRRCIVILDAYRRPDAGPAEFERAVEIAATLVSAAERAGLTTRFVTSPTIDLRGPEVAAATLRVLASILPSGPLDEIDRDPGDGLGMVIVVTPSTESAAWRRSERLLDPGLARIGVLTEGLAGRSSRLQIDASSIPQFLSNWDHLVGRLAPVPPGPPPSASPARSASDPVGAHAEVSG